MNNYIPVDTLVRAYELLSTTDMGMSEVARALRLNATSLSKAIKHTEEHGLSRYRTMKGRRLA